ncbi:hypothetical protein JKF63_04112 [Porcisia hertigi]|uniref:Uncharacterized protein n=1 Tax=Porcisia hertigi TaxID=2761500 RepID=A0A836IB24_9TRYP|nr:hypothetical protein JKF63_04112 [Porcisia hertigi]
MLSIVSIGTVVPSSTHYGTMLGKPIIYPDGYTIERFVFSSSKAAAQGSKPAFIYKAPSDASVATTKEELYFTATIRWVQEQPTFTITRSDNPAWKLYHDTKSPTTAWRKAFEDAAKDFPDRQAELLVPTDSKSKVQVNGIRLYGLHLKEVHDELVTLPGGQRAFDAAAAAASAAAAQAPLVVTAVAEELDARSTSLLSSPDPQSQSQSQSKTKRGRTVSPMPKVSPKAFAEKPNSTRSSKRQRTPSCRASLDKDASQAASTASLVVLSPADHPPTKDGAAKAPAKKPQPRKQKGAGKAAAAITTESTAAVSGDTAASTTVAPVKRRRTSSKTVNPKIALSSVAPVAPCPRCGLSGTAFCAATGHPHLPPPCTTCGLSTSFCPVTGQAHTGTAQRENRQRGEVHLPGVARKPRRLVSKRLPEIQEAADASAEVTEVAVISTQDGSGSAADSEKRAETTKKPRRKRLRAGNEAKQVLEDGVDVPADGTAEKPARVRRIRKTTGGAVAAAPSSEPQVADNEAIKADTGIDSSTTIVVVEAPPAPEEEQEYKYPPLRPPLTIREHHKAAQLLQESWKEQYGDGPILPAAVAAVPLPLVPAKRVAAAGPNRRQRGRSGVANGGAGGGEEGKQSDDDNGDGGEDETDGARAQGGDDNADREACKNGLRNTAGSPTLTTAAPLPTPTMVHPLEVTQLATSVAGKRLSRFLVQYTSERTLFDLLKNSAAADGGAGKKASKPLTQKVSAGGDAVGGAESDREAHTTRGDDGPEPTVDTPDASLAEEERQGSATRGTDVDDGAVTQE